MPFSPVIRVAAGSGDHSVAGDRHLIFVKQHKQQWPRAGRVGAEVEARLRNSEGILARYSGLNISLDGQVSLLAPCTFSASARA
jgi:hypothetical protein